MHRAERGAARTGHTVSFVGSGEAAVETVARNEHDVVLMDVAFSGIDGIGVTRRIRALAPPAGRIPIIGLSGRTETQDAAAAKAAGINAYLRKPASPAELNESAAGRCPGSSALDQSDDD